MFIFLLQSDTDTGYDVDLCAIEQSIKEYAWLNKIDVSSILYKDTLEQIQNNYLDKYKDCVPVGSIEFVEAFMNTYSNKKHISPILIPPELNKSEFTQRETAIIENTEDAINSFFDKYSELFIKSANICKDSFTDIYSKEDFRHLSEYIRHFSENKLFISETVDILSEWRIFVFNGKIQKIANYSGDEWLVPDKETVENMIAAYKNSSPAYTLDVAVLANGKTVIIEIHNFISCGLYGFESARIPIMLGRAWRYELDKQNNYNYTKENII